MIFKDMYKTSTLRIFYFIFYFGLALTTQGKNVQTDSLFYFQQVNALLEQKKYASAYFMLEEYLEQNGMRPFFACWMVEIGLNNFYRHENYNFFYLKDLDEQKSTPKLGEAGLRISRLRYPQRILEKIIQDYPGYAPAYKLLGDYFDLQLRDLSHFDFTSAATIKSLEEKIFNYYSQAEKHGYKNIQLNRWMGDYYFNRNQLELAQEYYLKNVKKPPPDGISLYRLAEISFQKKSYTQAYNFASEAVKNLLPEEFYLKYDALRITAKSLKELGETQKFVDTIQECVNLLPDVQDAYLDLIDFYKSQQNTVKIAALFREMLLKNPYELEGYRKLESYVIESRNYALADSLFEIMLLQYENWDEVLANIYWSKGNLAFARHSKAAAQNFWDISRNYMRRYLPENHKLIRQVGSLSEKK